MSQNWIHGIGLALIASIMLAVLRMILKLASARVSEFRRTHGVRRRIAAIAGSNSTSIRFVGQPAQCDIVIDCAREYGWLEAERNYAYSEQSFVRLFSIDSTSTRRRSELLRALERAVGLSTIAVGGATEKTS